MRRILSFSPFFCTATIGCLAPASFQPKPYAFDTSSADCDETPVIRWSLLSRLGTKENGDTKASRAELPRAAGDVALPANAGVECVYTAPMCLTYEEIWTGFRDLRCSTDHFNTFAQAH